MRVWLRSLLAALFAIGFASIALADKRVALIVANGDYRGAALGNPIFDADLVAASLRSIGFIVKVLKNADLGTFDSGGDRFRRRRAGRRSGAVLFRGPRLYRQRGRQAGQHVDVDVRRRHQQFGSRAEVRRHRARRNRQRPGGKAQATLVFVDACRNDPRLTRAVGGQARGFAPWNRFRAAASSSAFRRGWAASRETAQRAWAARSRAPLPPNRNEGHADRRCVQLRDAVKSETHGDQLPDIVQDDLPDGAITLVAVAAGPAGAERLPPTRVRSRPPPAAPRRPPSSSKPRKSGRPFATGATSDALIVSATQYANWLLREARRTSPEADRGRR